MLGGGSAPVTSYLHGRFVMSRSWIAGLVAVAVTFGLVPGVLAQQDRPASPRGEAATEVGGSWVTQENGRTRHQGGKWIVIDYGRPILRGRSGVFGSGEDYGKAVEAGAPVWRLGANQTTRLSTETPLILGGKLIEPGDYSLFVDLAEGAWTLIVSTQPRQESYDRENKAAIWGAYGYDPQHDVARAPMTVSSAEHSLDQLTIVFVDVTGAGGKIAMGWEKTLALVDFSLPAE
jgi:hypothetical protein